MTALCLRRSALLHPRRYVVAIAALILALGTGCGSASVAQEEKPIPSPAEPSSLDRVSNRGKPVAALLSGDKPLLERMARAGRTAGDIAILATRGDHAYYRLSEECYGIGPASPTTQTLGRALGRVSCSPAFPSSDRPVLDFTVFGGVGGSDESPPTKTVWRSEGLAADGIVTVAFLDAHGDVLAEASVSDNVYRFTRVPEASAQSLVAYTATGDIAFSQQIR